MRKIHTPAQISYHKQTQHKQWIEIYSMVFFMLYPKLIFYLRIRAQFWNLQIKNRNQTEQKELKIVNNTDYCYLLSFLFLLWFTNEKGNVSWKNKYTWYTLYTVHTSDWERINTFIECVF